MKANCGGLIVVVALLLTLVQPGSAWAEPIEPDTTDEGIIVEEGESNGSGSETQVGLSVWETLNQEGSSPVDPVDSDGEVQPAVDPNAESAMHPCLVDDSSAACGQFVLAQRCADGEFPPDLFTPQELAAICDAPGGVPVPVVTPEELAHRAYAELAIPPPPIRRSPPAENHDPLRGNQSYTWVQLWTWFWVDDWAPLTQTVRTPGVWATVVATPVSLSFDPGDGNTAVACEGPGRPWTDADANDAPSAGGCGYQYTQVTSDNDPVTSTVQQTWEVTWTGSGNTSGTLAPITTEASSTFLVMQIQVVIR